MEDEPKMTAGKMMLQSEYERLTQQLRKIMYVCLDRLESVCFAVLDLKWKQSKGTAPLG